MIAYHNFIGIGIDIGKFNFVVALHEIKTMHEYENSAAGISQFIEEHQVRLSDSLCVLEATGGYELKLLYTLVENNYAVHCADARKVKNFIRSFGNKAKTDKLITRVRSTRSTQNCFISGIGPQSKR